MLPMLVILFVTGIANAPGPLPLEMFPDDAACQQAATVIKGKLRPDQVDVVHLVCVEYSPS